jgi:DNA-binding NarL/FixJ family response regulator
MRVLLIDAHHLIRAGIRRLLDAMPEVEVIGESGTLQAVLRGGHGRADVVLVDPNLADAPPGGAIAELRSQLPGAALLVLSASTDPNSVRRALADGALGYITHDSSAADLELALRALAGRNAYISPALTHRLAERRAPHRNARPQVFSARQRDVLRLIGLGKSTREIRREISQTLGISVKTVETHRARLMESLDVRGSAELMRYALLTSGAR